MRSNFYSFQNFFTGPANFHLESSGSDVGIQLPSTCCLAFSTHILGTLHIPLSLTSSSIFFNGHRQAHSCSHPQSAIFALAPHSCFASTVRFSISCVCLVCLYSKILSRDDGIALYPAGLPWLHNLCLPFQFPALNRKEATTLYSRRIPMNKSRLNNGNRENF